MILILYTNTICYDVLAPEVPSNIMLNFFSPFFSPLRHRTSKSRPRGLDLHPLNFVMSSSLMWIWSAMDTSVASGTYCGRCFRVASGSNQAL